MITKSIYLGDGAYAKYDGYHVVIFTSNGERVLNEIYLDSQVQEALVLFINYIKNKDKDE